MVFGLCLVTVLLAPSCNPVFHDGGGVVTAACRLLLGPLAALASWRLARLQPEPLPAPQIV